MENITFRTTVVIRLPYHIVNNTAERSMVESISNSIVTNAAKSSCAVCGSQLHMTKHCPVHP